LGLEDQIVGELSAKTTLPDYGRVARDTGVDETPAVRQRSLSFLDKLLDKIRNNQSTSAIEMDAVGVKVPAIGIAS
jgi:hypothetical protein